MSDPFRSDLEAARRRIEQLEAEHGKRVDELEEENRRLRARLIDRRGPRPRQRRSPARIVLPVAMLVLALSLALGFIVARQVRPPAARTLEPAPDSDSGASAFDLSAAAEALAAVRVQECATPNGPRGTGHVKVTFLPSGLANRAEVEAAGFAHTLVGDCIAEHYRGARMPPFSGPPVTVTKSFRIE